MSSREYFLKKWEQEQTAFGKVLRALPDGQLDYRPHERSASAGGIAWQLAYEQHCFGLMAGKGEIAWDMGPRPATLDEIVAAWDKSTEEVRSLLADVDEAKWKGEVTFLMNGAVVDKGTLEDYFWGFLLDMIHHRGQLSAYIRPMGGKVPAIYGPSADDSGS